MMKIYVVIFLGCVLPSIALAEKISTFTLPSEAKVEIVESAFQKENFDIDGCSPESSFCLIDGDIPYGVVSGLPKTYVKEITVSFQGAYYALDVTGMYNAWGGRPLEHAGVVRYFGGACFDSKNCRFRGLFSDAAASFVAEWLIMDGISRRTVLTNSNDVVNLFMKNIDPPVFD